MTHANLRIPQSRPDWNRSFALGTAIAVNLAGLVALSMARPDWQPAPASPPVHSSIEIVWPSEPLLIPEEPPTPPRPERVLVRTPVPPMAATQAPGFETTMSPVDTFTPFESLPADAYTSSQAALPIGVGSDVVDRDAGVALSDPSAPPYPAVSIRNRHEGTVILEVTVDATGAATGVRVVRSSGHLALDRSARSHVLRAWAFQPALRDGVPIAARVRIPIAFSLVDR